MSIKVSKILQINSIDYLYKILRDDDELISKNNMFQIFLDCMTDYYFGCKCMEEEYLSLCKLEYNNISKNEDVISSIKEHFECDDVIFS
jgi:hypothetical protein